MKLQSFFRLAWPVCSVLLAATSIAHAHNGSGEIAGFAHGFSHPLSGWDHLLAMLAVGIWASQLAVANRRALWAVPASFVGVMMLGAMLGASGLALPAVEAGIASSVLVLGILIASAARLPLGACMALAGAFALFHGHAHGAEMPATANGFLYGAGFMCATILLHAAGVGAALAAQKLFSAERVLPLRFAGTTIALCGLAMLAL